MKKVTLLLAVALLLWSCTTNEKETDDRILHIAQDIRKGEQQERSLLLALKYNVDEKSVFDMLKEESTVDFTGDIVEGLLESFKGVTKDELESYSIKYNIPVKVVASIFLDVKMLECTYGEESFYDSYESGDDSSPY